MGGADSTNERAEEEREDPPAKRPEIRELLEEHKALIREHLRSYEHRPHFMRSFGSSAEKVEVDSRTSSCGCMRSARSMDHLAYFNRAEEEREAASAKRREIRELLEEHNALMWGYVRPYEPGPIISSFGSSAEKVEVDSRTSSYGCMRRARSMDHLADFNRAEEKREAAPAKRPEIRKLLGEHNALMWQIVSVGVRTSIFLLRLLFSVGVRTSHIILSFLTILFTMSGVEEKLRSLKRQSEALKRPESMMSMQRDRPMEIPPPVKLPDPPSMQIVSPLKPRPNIPRQIVSPYEPQPNIFRPIPEKRRAGSPASSSESMKSNRSMTLPVSVKRPASCESVKSDQSMGPPIAFKREHLGSREPRPHLLPRLIVSPYEPQPNIFRPKSNPEKMRAASPASSCGSMRSDGRSIPEKRRAGSAASSSESMKSNRSMTLPVSVKRPASCESVKSDQSMGPPIAFKREDFCDIILRQIVSHYEPQPNISSFLNIPFTMGGAEEDVRAEEGTEDSLLKRWIMELQQKAGSPAPSCRSLKTDRSRTPPLNFRDEPGPSDTKDPGIDAGLWTQLNSIVSHLQEHISDCQNEMNTLKKFVRAINPEGQGEYEEGVKCERESTEKRQQRGIAEDHTGLPEKNESRGTGRLTTGQSSCSSGPT